MLEAELTYGCRGHEVLNCGISGNRVVDLLARWKRDCLNLRPDVLTVLIGVNDVWHEFEHKNGVNSVLFEETYRLLLKEAVQELPGVRIILMGAFLTHGSVPDDKWDVFSGEVAARREAARRVAEEWNTSYVDLQKVFDSAQSRFPSCQWTQDGVHPTAAGHKLIAEEWLRVFREEG